MVFDLATAYPMLLPPSLVLNRAAEKIESTHLQVFGSRARQVQQLAGVTAEILSIRDGNDRIFFTFSGSVAIDRALSAVGRLAQSRGRVEVQLVAMQPCLDLVLEMAAERRGWSTVFAGGLGPSFATGTEVVYPYPPSASELQAKIQETQRFHPRRQLCVFLTLPSNPGGFVYSEDELEQIMLACARSDAILIADHCFLVAGVHFAEQLPTVWGLPNGLCDWIGIWDTGKTVNSGGEKLGVLVAGSDRISAAVDESLEVIQVGVSGTAVRMFGDLFPSMEFQDYLLDLREACLANLTWLAACLPRPGRVLAPRAGSVATVEVGDGHDSCDSEAVRADWLARGVGVVNCDAFYREGMPPRRFLRISLARPPKYFENAFRFLCESR